MEIDDVRKKSKNHRPRILVPNRARRRSGFRLMLWGQGLMFSGIRNAKTLPWPGSLSTQMRPPWVSAVALQNVSPSPLERPFGAGAAALAGAARRGRKCAPDNRAACHAAIVQFEDHRLAARGIALLQRGPLREGAPAAAARGELDGVAHRLTSTRTSFPRRRSGGSGSASRSCRRSSRACRASGRAWSMAASISFSGARVRIASRRRFCAASGEVEQFVDQPQELLAAAGRSVQALLLLGGERAEQGQSLQAEEHGLERGAQIVHEGAHAAAPIGLCAFEPGDVFLELLGAQAQLDSVMTSEASARRVSSSTSVHWRGWVSMAQSEPSVWPSAVVNGMPA